MDITSFILGLQKGKSMGGGSSADVRYVTFVGADGKVLYKKAVAVGDDCVDVAAKGLISTPTKEMTVAEVYTFNGWSLIEGGAASSSALKNVTEDRTVYAAFTATARKYTVRFYDGDTLLKTDQVAYGSVATPPDTTKDGYSFVAWSPSDLTVYGDTDFIGEWEKIASFASVASVTISDSEYLRNDITISNDGRYVAGCGNTAAKEKRPVLYDISGDTPVSIGSSITHTYEGYVNSVAFSTDDKYLATYCSNYPNYYINVSIKANEKYWNNKAIQAVVAATNFYFCDNDRIIMKTSSSLRMVSVSSGSLIGSLTFPFTSGYYTVTGDKSKVVVLSDDNAKAYIYSIDASSFTLIKEVALAYDGHKVNNAHANRDGTRLVMGTYNGDTANSYKMYDLNTGAMIYDFAEHLSGSSVYANIVGQYLVLAKSTTVKIFEISGEAPVEMENLPTYSGTSIAEIGGNSVGDHIVFRENKYFEVWKMV